jgi:hypothetical protein
MRRTARSRMLTALAVVAAHVLMVALLALEVPTLITGAAGPAPQGVTVTLAPPFSPQTRAPPSQPKPPRVEADTPSPLAAPQVRPSTPAEARTAAAEGVELPNLARPVFRTWPRPLPGGVDWGSATGFGCDDPDAYHLSAKAREKCLERWGREPRREIAALIGKEKRGAFERRMRCRDEYELAPVPSGTTPSGKTAPIGSPMFNPPASLAGLGSNPSLKDCPLSDR